MKDNEETAKGIVIIVAMFIILWAYMYYSPILIH